MICVCVQSGNFLNYVSEPNEKKELNLNGFVVPFKHGIGSLEPLGQ